MELVVIKGGGDLASGVAHRLHRAGFRILITELPQPLAVRRTVAFSSAISQLEIVVENVRARRVSDAADAERAWSRDEIAVRVDPCARSVAELQPLVVVDAIMAKANRGTHIGDAPIVIALGPGFVAGVDAHAVVETNRGPNLGRVFYSGSAAPNTNEPAPVNGVTHARVLRAPRDGTLQLQCEIGAHVKADQIVAVIDAQPVRAQIAGVLRGIAAEGTPVRAGMKIGDVDPSGDVSRCYSISDKSRAIGGGVLEAILYLRRQL